MVTLSVGSLALSDFSPFSFRPTHFWGNLGRVIIALGNVPDFAAQSDTRKLSAIGFGVAQTT